MEFHRVILVVSGFFCAVGSFSQKYVICGLDSITLYSTGGFSQLVIVSQNGDYYNRGLNCTTRIVSTDLFLGGFIVSYRTIDIPNSESSCRDYVKVFTSFESYKQCGRSRLIDQETSAYSRVFKESSLGVNWFTEGPASQSVNARGFEMTVTGYRRSFLSCPRNMFRCRNGNCIDKKWRCNGRNNCGDLSDEEGCSITGIIIGAVLSVVAVIFIITAVILFLRRRRRTMIRTTIISNQVAVQPAYHPPYQPPAGTFQHSPAGPYQQHVAPYPRDGQNPVYSSGNVNTQFQNRIYNATEAPPPYRP